MTKRRRETYREDPREARVRIRQELAAEGLDEAVAALRGICRDPNAPAPAKATAGVAIMRAIGLFDAKNADEGDDKDMSEMTLPELFRQIARTRPLTEIEARHAGLPAGVIIDDDDADADDDDGESVFD